MNVDFLNDISKVETSGAMLDDMVENMAPDFVGKKFTLKGIQWDEPMIISTIYYDDEYMWGDREGGTDRFRLDEIEWLEDADD